MIRRHVHACKAEMHTFATIIGMAGVHLWFPACTQGWFFYKLHA
jgi:hypothetical protein